MHHSSPYIHNIRLCHELHCLNSSKYKSPFQWLFNPFFHHSTQFLPFFFHIQAVSNRSQSYCFFFSNASECELFFSSLFQVNVLFSISRHDTCLYKWANILYVVCFEWLQPPVNRAVVCCDFRCYMHCTSPQSTLSEGIKRKLFLLSNSLSAVTYVLCIWKLSSEMLIACTFVIYLCLKTKHPLIRMASLNANQSMQNGYYVIDPFYFPFL